MKLSTINDDIFTRGLKTVVGTLPEAAQPKVWWQPQTRQAFLSVSRRADPALVKVCREAIARVVGVQNIEVKPEAEPSLAKGTPWLRVAKDAISEGSYGNYRHYNRRHDNPWEPRAATSQHDERVTRAAAANDEHYRNVCLRKTKYKYRGQAEHDIRNIVHHNRSHTPEALVPYQCYYCGFWHAGHNKRRQQNEALIRAAALLDEGVVAVARGDIINLINDSAAKVARAAQEMGFPKPKSEFTNDGSTPAVVNIQAGRNRLFQDSQTIAIAVHGDSEFKIELPAAMADALGVANFYPQRSADEVSERLQEIRAAMRDIYRHKTGMGA